MHRTDVAIIGAGQAGLAMSACLRRAGIDHCVIERGRVGERWRGERRPGLRLLTPAWMTRLPGMTPPDAHPESFLPISAFADQLDRYAADHEAPILAGCAVEAVERHGKGFRLTTSRGTFLSRAVVIATGACDRPDVPAWAARLPASVAQFAADACPVPAALPSGGILVVGASASGLQIASELAVAGREVSLAVGRHVRAPRRYRGRDLFAWLDACGFLAAPRREGSGDGRAAPSLPLVGGREPGGGAALELSTLHRAGVRVMGRALGAEDGAMQFSQALSYEVETAERRRATLLGAIDLYIARAGDPVAPEPAAWQPPGPLPAPPARLDLAADGIGTVVWATGYRRSYPWLRLPVLGPDGEIRQTGGVTELPGLYVLGLPYMRHRASALIDGVGRDAEALTLHIARNLGVPASIAA